MQKIEKRPLADIPDFIHDIMAEYIKDNPKNDDVVTAQYFDVAFRAGWTMAKNYYSKL